MNESLTRRDRRLDEGRHSGNGGHRKHPQGYPGYIPANQLKQVTEGSAPVAISHIVCQKRAMLYRNGQADMEISFLTELTRL
ncbi:hypothetical protein ACEQPO_10265 [Bacillus sp. SL00103]